MQSPSTAHPREHPTGARTSRFCSHSSRKLLQPFPVADHDGMAGCPERQNTGAVSLDCDQQIDPSDQESSPDARDRCAPCGCTLPLNHVRETLVSIVNNRHALASQASNLEAYPDRGSGLHQTEFSARHGIFRYGAPRRNKSWVVPLP